VRGSRGSNFKKNKGKWGWIRPSPHFDMFKNVAHASEVKNGDEQKNDKRVSSYFFEKIMTFLAH